MCFFVYNSICDEFMCVLVKYVEGLKVGNGFEEGMMFGVFVNLWCLIVMVLVVDNVCKVGVSIEIGGEWIGVEGNFFVLIVIVNVLFEVDVFNNELFGFVVVICGFDKLEEVIVEVNCLLFGLVGYVFMCLFVNVYLLM